MLAILAFCTHCHVDLGAAAQPPNHQCEIDMQGFLDSKIMLRVIDRSHKTVKGFRRTDITLARGVLPLREAALRLLQKSLDLIRYDWVYYVHVCGLWPMYFGQMQVTEYGQP